VSAKIDPGIVCTYLYIISREGYPPSAEKTCDHLADMQSLGFVSVELEGIRKEHLLGIYENRVKIADTIRRLELQVPYFCTVLPGLSAPDKMIREENLEHFEKGCEIAKLFGSRGVLDNAPLPPYLFPGDIPVVRHYGEAELRQAWLPEDLSWPEYQDVLISTFRTVCEISATYGLTYNMHPALGVLAATTDAFLNFCEKLKMENLRFNLDTANQYFMKENLILALHRSINYIDYIHLSDNGGDRVEHLPPGQGTIPWDRFFETLDRLGFRGHIGIDIGGEESGLKDIGTAYRETADWITAHWNKR
jgi:sugar phosphate isomerase/epimerase